MSSIEQTHPAQDSEGSFAELGIRSEIVDALADQGITHPFRIQTLAIPIALAGSDLIGQARTGTGKTLAFGVPLLDKIDLAAAPGRAPQALIVAPTRELATQVASDMAKAASHLNVRVEVFYGGRAYEPQVEALRAGIDIAVGTPGRLLDLASRRDLRLDEVKFVVLDEADEMLDLGFLPDIERLLGRIPTTRQTMLFSATMPVDIVMLSRRFLVRPVNIRAEDPDEAQGVPTTRQLVYATHPMDKPEVLARLLQAEGRGLTMVFCRTKRAVDTIATELERRGFAVAAIHGDIAQGARERALRAFRNGKIDVLVATDVAARGIDVTGVTHVVNYQTPEDERTYLHRIGRTGRAGNDGIAVTFVDWNEVMRWKLINKALDLDLAEPPEIFSTSPQLYSDLGIPENATGTLPKADRTREGLYAEKIEDLGTGRPHQRGDREPRRDREARGDREPRKDAGSRTRSRRRPRVRSRNGVAVSGAEPTTEIAG